MPSLFAYPRPDLPTATPGDTAEAAAIIREAGAAKRAVLARGGGTKWSIGGQPNDGNPIILSTTNLRGITEYDPGELTFTAKAGTPLSEVEAALTANGQYLPFDPPFANAGATLGGTIAAGLSGPRRMRYGGLRDFVLGIDYLSAEGTTVRGGGKVVKNAAGYDLPKLFCGSLGTLGVIVQASFKVFPMPQSRQTLLAELDSAQAVQAALLAVQRSTLEVSAADAWSSGTVSLPSALSSAVGKPYVLAIQIDGTVASLNTRLDALRALLPLNAPTAILSDAAESEFWSGLRDVTWINAAESVLRLYLPPNRLADLDTCLQNFEARCVYSVAGNVAWAALTDDPARLTPHLEKLGARAAIWRAPGTVPEILPTLPGAALVKRIKHAFDPNEMFYPGRYAAG